MKLSRAAQAAARLAVVNEKSQAALSKVIFGWYIAQFIKSAKLQQLRAVHQAGAYAAFAELLSEATDADRMTLLKKADPHNTEILVRSKLDIMGHVEALASGEIEPTTKPFIEKAPAKKAPKGKKQVGIISASKY